MIDGKRGGGGGRIEGGQRGGGRVEGQREGVEAARRGGGIGGGEIGARVEGRQEGTTRRKGSACRSGMGAAPRACVYI